MKRCRESLVYSRIREITDALGDRLRISVEPHPEAGALVMIQRTGIRGAPRILLDGFGADVLSGYIMSARLALPGTLPPEEVDGAFPSSLSLTHAPQTALVMSQPAGGARFEIPATFWDRLFAELCIVNAHAREFGRRGQARLQ
jgi:hypothetical protein